MSFGELPIDAKERPIRMAVPARSVNSIEQELNGLLGEAIMTHADVPMVFYEDGMHNADDFIPLFGRPLSLDEAMAIGGIMAEPIVERFRRAIVIARDLGERATVAEYVAACLIEGVNPLLTE